MRRGRATVAAACVLLVAGAAAADASRGRPRVARLTILHTSDLHGHVLPFDDPRNEPAGGSLAEVATLVERARATAPGSVLVLDSGDAIQGTPLELFTAVRGGEPSPTVAAMNAIGYRAMAVGNHEFNFGLDHLERVRGEARFPFLSANVVVAATGRPLFEPYVVAELAGLRVGILGLTTPNIPGWEQPEHYRGLRFEPPDEAARIWVPRLRREGCDLVIVLAHTGFERDLESGSSTGTEHEDFAWRLTSVSGIDLLLTGHTHLDISPRLVNGVIVAQPACYARRVTRIDLELKRRGRGWRLVRWSGENLDPTTVPADEALAGRFEVAHQRVVRLLDRPLGEVAAPLAVATCRLADCAAVDLLHAVQLETTGADLSLASTLSDETPPLPAGEITWRWVYAFYVYANTLVSLRVTGSQVRAILEYAARYYDGLDCSGSGGCVVLTDRSIPGYNVDSMAGVSYRIDPTRPEGERVRDLRYGGRPLDPQASLTLACNSYRAAGGGEYPFLAEAEVVWRGADEMTELLGAFLERHSPWPAVADGNWLLAPDVVAERWLEPGGGGR